MRISFKQEVAMAKKKTVKVDMVHCKGCRYCVDACPKGALALGRDMNTAGYPYVMLDPEKCIGCGTCYTVCPDYVFTIMEEEGA